VLAGILALLIAFSSSPSAGQEERPRLRGAYRPGAVRGPHEATQPGAGVATTSSVDGALSPRLEERLRAAAHVATMPASTPPGALPPLPSTGPLPPGVEAGRHRALAGWQTQAQQLLDECVARPAPERKPVALDVVFASRPAVGGTAAQLAPVAVSIPPHELRRLWRDTDPDELQGCLERMRALPLPALPAPRGAAQASLTSPETVLVQI
jgi:hypothetical protein